MHSYLYSAVNKKGRKVTERVSAASAAAAREWLLSLDYRDIQFHTDDMNAMIDQSLRRQNPDAPDPQEVFNAKREKAARSGGGVWRELLAAFRSMALPWIALLFWNAKTVYQGPPFSLMDWVGFALLIAFALFFFWMVVPGVAFQKLLEAGVWYRFEEQRRWISLVRFMKRFTPIPIPAMELDFREAAGHAAEGYLDHALTLVAIHDTPVVGKFMYYSRLSGIYETARRYDEMIDLRRKALEHGTGNPAEHIDLALGLVSRLHKPAEARAQLTGIDPTTSSEMIQYFFYFVRGLIALEESDWGTAKTELELSLQKSAGLGHNALVKSTRLTIGACLGMALAKLGDIESGRKLIEQARPLLKARREDELLARCDAALT